MNSELPNDIRAFKEKSLNFNKLVKGYNEELGLSVHGPSTDLFITLPLHPTTLQKELDDYKDYATRLEAALIHRDTKERFLRLLLQDPPFDLTDEELQAAEKRAGSIDMSIKAGLDKLNRIKLAIAEKNAKVEELYTSVSEKTDNATRMLDEIQIYSEELQSIQELLTSQSDLTLEDASKIEEDLTSDIVQANMEIDERRDNINRLNRQVTDSERTIEDLESRLQALRAEASGTQLYKEQYQQLETSTNWYQAVTKELNNLVGIDDFVSTPSKLTLRYADTSSTELHISINPKSGLVENASVTNTNLQIRDILELAKRHRRPSDVIIAIVYGTLARLKKTM